MMQYSRPPKSAHLAYKVSGNRPTDDATCSVTVLVHGTTYYSEWELASDVFWRKQHSGRNLPGLFAQLDDLRQGLNNVREIGTIPQVTS